MTIFLTIIGVIFLISGTMFAYEVKHAPLINEEETPFKNKENHYETTFCMNCKFFDGTAMCLNEDNFGQINEKKTSICEGKSLFEAM